MPLNYLDLTSQVREMGMDALAREDDVQRTRQRLSALLIERAVDLDALRSEVEAALVGNSGLRCAVPVSEPLNARVACQLPAATSTILAADGSQINPSGHDSVFYGLVNVGIFCIQPGSGKAPVEMTKSSLIYGENLFPASGAMSEDLIALLRDVQERRALAELASAIPAPVITLTDGPLELYQEPRGEDEFKGEFKKYLAALDNMALNNVITAGYVSRPRANLVVKLLTLPEDSAAAEPMPPGISDLALFANLLQPGERSAIFRLQSRSAKEYADHKALHFFYLNAGSAVHPAFARVEIPRWVAENEGAIGLLHATLVEQAAQSGDVPYPYPLIRAHEIAVVKMADRQQLTAMIERELIRLGIKLPNRSEKDVNKTHTGRTRIKR